MNNGQPYWDGSKWVMPSPPPTNSGVLTAGWLCAVFIPVIGLVLGLTQINRSREGLWIVLTSVGAAFVYVVMFSSL